MKYNGFFCLNDYKTQRLWWRRRQDTFEDYSAIVRNYYHNGGQLSLYFETENGESPEGRILLAARTVNHYEVEMYTTSRYITPQNFLKENGGYTVENVLGIGDIIRETKTMQDIM